MGLGRYTEAAAQYQYQLQADLAAHGPQNVAVAMDAGMLSGAFLLLGQYGRAEQFAREQLAALEVVSPSDLQTRINALRTLSTAMLRQGRLAEADSTIAHALPLAEEQMLQSAKNADSAGIRLQLADMYTWRGDLGRAEELTREAIELYRAEFPQGDRSTAMLEARLAQLLVRQERYLEAQPHWEASIAFARQKLGTTNPATIERLSELGLVQYALGEYDEAERTWSEVARTYPLAKLRLANSGIERARFAAEHVPLDYLAAVMARRGVSREAAQQLEESLGRGLLDDLSARQLRRMSSEDSLRERRLIAEIQDIDEQIAQLSRLRLTADNEQDLNQLFARLRQEQLRAEHEWTELQTEFARQYGPAAGEVMRLETVQRLLLDDEALIAWLDRPGAEHMADPNGEHWGVVIRAQGDPRWTRLRGSGDNGQWTQDDQELTGQFRLSLTDGNRSAAKARAVRALADEVYHQRLQPLEAFLEAGDGLPRADHLIVLPSWAMSGLPLDGITDKYTVSYSPSATVLAMIRQRRSNQKRAANEIALLAVGNPKYDRKDPDMPFMTGTDLPKEGAFVQQVVSPSSALEAGILPGDIIVEYAGRTIKSGSDLPTVVAQLGANSKGQRKVPVRLWRDGRWQTVQARLGRLGVGLAQGSAREAWLASHSTQKLLAEVRRDSVLRPLPGAEREARALVDLVHRRGGRTRLLLGDEASERALTELAAADELRDYQLLHFATHATVNPYAATESSLMLAADAAAQKQINGQSSYDGRLSASQIAQQWSLRADLVVLSACQSALGEHLAGEGYVGFAQALFLAGADSLVVSLWPVDDIATSLLMVRFYENLLGARETLAGPMPKAEALTEAKRWLRGLSAAEVPDVATLSSDEIRRLSANGQRPFAHPNFWSAFILVGEPR